MKHAAPIWFLLFLLLSLQACFEPHEEFDTGELIPKERLSELLTDLYLADGILLKPHVRQEYSRRDSFANYNDIIQEHGYTREQLNETFRYYTSQKPEELEGIYDKVGENLTRMEAENLELLRDDEAATRTEGAILKKEGTLEELRARDNTQENLWTGKDIYRLPEDGPQEIGWQKIPVRGTGTYTLSANIQMFPDDESRNPKMTACFFFDDGTEIGARDTYVSTEIKKDGALRRYTLTKELRDPKYTHIIIWIFNHNSQKTDQWKKHAIGRDIMLTYSPALEEAAPEL